MLRSLSLFLFCFFLAGCSYLHPYRPNIEQGNVMTAKTISQLHVGMTKAQVVKIMGAPILHNTFDDNLTIYAYQYLPNNGPRIRKTITIYFENGVVSSIEKQDASTAS